MTKSRISKLLVNVECIQEMEKKGHIQLVRELIEALRKDLLTEYKSGATDV